jgi:integrase
MASPRREPGGTGDRAVGNHTDPDPPSAEEAAAVIAAAWSDSDWGSLLWVMMVSGMRRGEISALRWRHVDFATETLIGQRANAQPKSGVKEKQTKTQQQRRIAIDPQTAALLPAHRERCEQRCRLLGAWLPAATCSSFLRRRTHHRRTVHAP